MKYIYTILFILAAQFAYSQLHFGANINNTHIITDYIGSAETAVNGLRFRFGGGLVHNFGELNNYSLSILTEAGLELDALNSEAGKIVFSMRNISQSVLGAEDNPYGWGLSLSFGMFANLNYAVNRFKKKDKTDRRKR